MTETQTDSAHTTEVFECANCGFKQDHRKFCSQCGASTVPAILTLASSDSYSVLVQHRPTGVSAPGPETRLPFVIAQGGKTTTHWLGVHGGAGESTLARAMPGSVAGGNGWPVTASGFDQDPELVPVVLVARSHGSGLLAAQNALREWASGSVKTVSLLGLVVIADSPIRLPKELRALQRLVAGGAPNFWTIPYIPNLRLAPVDTDVVDTNIVRVCRAIQTLVNTL